VRIPWIFGQDDHHYNIPPRELAHTLPMRTPRQGVGFGGNSGDGCSMCTSKRELSMPVATSAEDFVPPQLNLSALRRAAKRCQGCDLYKNATQTVFGEGPRRARMILLGEVLGDEEDKQGKPFVGPAGRLLDNSIEEAGISRDEVYITNAVKHFRWEPRGKRRLHKKPTSRQIEACRPWLQAEILVIEPKVIVCLGATASQVMLGDDFRITKHRGKFYRGDEGTWLTATYHPSAILRAPAKADRQRMQTEFVDDLKRAAKRLATVTSRTK
jgi:uracil-DNA glycosylase